MNYESEIIALKRALADTDHHTIKFIEGCPSPNWEKIKLRRQKCRDRLNEIAAELKAMLSQRDGGIVAMSTVDSESGGELNSNFDPAALLASISFMPFNLE